MQELITLEIKIEKLIYERLLKIDRILGYKKTKKMINKKFNKIPCDILILCGVIAGVKLKNTINDEYFLIHLINKVTNILNNLSNEEVNEATN